MAVESRQINSVSVCTMRKFRSGFSSREISSCTAAMAMIWVWMCTVVREGVMICGAAKSSRAGAFSLPRGFLCSSAAAAHLSESPLMQTRRRRHAQIERIPGRFIFPGR